MKEHNASVWIFFPTGDLFLMEELKGQLKDGYKITMGDNLIKLFDINNDVFIDCCVCLGEL